MGGWIKFHRKILDNEIWQDVTAFRLFTLLLLKASHKDGMKTRGIEVNRGQYLRAYSKLAEDLEYMEGRGLKKVSKSTVERKVKKLVDASMVSVSETVSGTLFTITKYDDYQGSDDIIENPNGTDDETNVGRTRDDRGTNVGQEQELKNLRTKELSNTTTTTPVVDDFAEVFQTFESNLCKLSPLQRDSLGMWYDDFKQNKEIIIEAVKIADDRNRKNFGFVEYLFKEWANNKLTTVEQVQSHERNKFNKPNNHPSNRGRYGSSREEKVPEWFHKQQKKESRAESSVDIAAERDKLIRELQQGTSVGN
ncbi:DnaD domain protein [Sporosarcina sp. resist]|uniref:DnaD domain-containing protein n=1 Tax=Sporosarcina sp. resist TaxID=2762563 RepID=UPI00164DE69E|nr:DnaD domain protein [Sporosarcina sp. resist]QNK86463.1 DnaD domain protein [Sporosarcina sp. resist]